MKPKLLLCGRWGWAATSPLIYTIQRSAQYAHFGYTKAFTYLEQFFKATKKGSGHCQDIYDKVVAGTWENDGSDTPSSHKMNTTQDLEPLKDFPLENFTKLLYGMPTISKYMEFYHALHDHVTTKGYKSVGDGYSLPRTGPSPYVSKFYDALKSEFDVKVVWITRDPVRRAFSNYLSERQKFQDASFINLPVELRFPKYIERIEESNKIFGRDNVHTVVMEELWEDDGTSKQQLSDFLDHPITKLWNNVYAPDRGHLAGHDSNVPCQAYGQNLQVLTEDVYYHYKDKHQHQYDEWVDEFGSLPLYWGQHLDYNTGRPL